MYSYEDDYFPLDTERTGHVRSLEEPLLNQLLHGNFVLQQYTRKLLASLTSYPNVVSYGRNLSPKGVYVQFKDIRYRPSVESWMHQVHSDEFTFRYHNTVGDTVYYEFILKKDRPSLHFTKQSLPLDIPGYLSDAAYYSSSSSSSS